MLKKIIKKLNLKIIVFFLLLSFASPSLAATLYFDPSVGSLGPDNTFALDIFVNVENCVNTIEADVSFPYEQVEIQDFIVGESILSIWLKKPNKNDFEVANKTGILNFSGGIPGGYCGKIPGDPGQSNKVARLIFHVKDLGEKSKDKLNFLFLPSTQVLLNDGLGTKDTLTAKTASFKYLKEKVAISNEWQKQIDDDTIAPEPFIIELRRNKRMFNNQYYIIFSTVDKQSGLDHFEVLEIRPDQEVGVVQANFWDKLWGKSISAPSWKVANIPYLLEDQDLLSTIRVKAVDKAGNERFVEYVPPRAKTAKTTKSNTRTWIVGLGLLFLGLVLLALLIVFIRGIIIKKKYDKE